MRFWWVGEVQLWNSCRVQTAEALLYSVDWTEWWCEPVSWWSWAIKWLQSQTAEALLKTELNSDVNRWAGEVQLWNSCRVQTAEALLKAELNGDVNRWAGEVQLWNSCRVQTAKALLKTELNGDVNRWAGEVQLWNSCRVQTAETLLKTELNGDVNRWAVADKPPNRSLILLLVSTPSMP